MDYSSDSLNGEFLRPDSLFRNWITTDGSSGFPAEPGRYHLYVSLACPWAHRTLILRRLKSLEDVISLSVVRPVFEEDDWAFGGGPGCIPDTINGCKSTRELYLKADPNYTGMVTVPVLWDKKTSRIVNNESSEIVRMFNSAFDAWGNAEIDYYPAKLRNAIDEINAFVYSRINNGVYRAGFARSQSAYDRAVRDLFEALDLLEERLGRQPYLVGDRISEADWRLFTTLVRFDPVYVCHFKCNLRRLIDYPNLWAYARELYQIPGIADTVDFDHIKQHYFRSHASLNPRGIIPLGPRIDFMKPHGRR